MDRGLKFDWQKAFAILSGHPAGNYTMADLWSDWGSSTQSSDLWASLSYPPDMESPEEGAGVVLCWDSVLHWFSRKTLSCWTNRVLHGPFFIFTHSLSGSRASPDRTHWRQCFLYTWDKVKEHISVCFITALSVWLYPTLFCDTCFLQTIQGFQL